MREENKGEPEEVLCKKDKSELPVSRIVVAIGAIIWLGLIGLMARLVFLAYRSVIR